MAGLKKPTSPCQCGFTDTKRLFHPERWVCNACGEVIVSRGVKPQIGICRICGKSRNEVSFHKHGNICATCRSEYNQQYVEENRQKVNDQKREYYAANKDKIRKRANAYWQGSPEVFLSDAFHRIKESAARRFGSRARKLPFELTREFLIELYHQQKGLCAISQMPMKHKWNDLCSISVDRVDSDLGYVRGNVQLVCKWVNLAKGRHSNGEFTGLLDMYYFKRRERDAGLDKVEFDVFK